MIKEIECPEIMTTYDASRIYYKNKVCFYEVVESNKDRPDNEKIRVLATYDKGDNLFLQNRELWEKLNSRTGILGILEGEEILLSRHPMIGGIRFD